MKTYSYAYRLHIFVIFTPSLSIMKFNRNQREKIAKTTAIFDKNPVKILKSQVYCPVANLQGTAIKFHIEDGMNVTQCMKTKVILANPEDDFTTLLSMIAAPEPRQIYVVDSDCTLLGIITAFDLLKQIIPSYMTADLSRSITDSTDFMQSQVKKVEHKLAKELMVSDFVYVTTKSELFEADALIVEKGCNALPVLSAEKKLVGEVTRLDILIHFVDNGLIPGHSPTSFVDLSKM